MRTPQFCALWLMLFLNVTAGILFISNAVPIMLSGSTARGNANLVTSPPPCEMLCTPNVRLLAKNPHGTSAAKANKGYGAPKHLVFHQPMEKSADVALAHHGRRRHRT